MSIGRVMNWMKKKNVYSVTEGRIGQASKIGTGAGILPV